MSGLEEQDRLFVFSYDEYVYTMEDYVSSYRGVMARNLSIARRLIRQWMNDMIEEYYDGDVDSMRLNYIDDMSDPDSMKKSFIINDTWI